jgi:hypothetical protein
MEKLYAYVDETGQETAGVFFLVAVVIAGDDRDGLLEWLSAVEQATGKGKTPWHKSRHHARQAYMDRVLNDARLRGSVFYAVYPGTRAYQRYGNDSPENGPLTVGPASMGRRSPPILQYRSSQHPVILALS